MMITWGRANHATGKAQWIVAQDCSCSSVVILVWDVPNERLHVQLMMMLMIPMMMTIVMIVMMMMMMPEWDNSSGKERRHIWGNERLLSKLPAHLGYHICFFIIIIMITLKEDKMRWIKIGKAHWGWCAWCPQSSCRGGWRKNRLRGCTLAFKKHQSRSQNPNVKIQDKQKREKNTCRSCI